MAKMESGPRGRVRVVVADDDHDERLLLEDWLARHGSFEVVEVASDGVDAVDAARRVRPELVVLDLAMPRMDGLAAATEIRSLLPTARIVVRSSFSAERMAQRAIDAGADVYVEKAAESAELLAVLEGLFPDRPREPATAQPAASTPEPRAPASLDDRLLDAVDAGVLVVDDDGCVLSANFQATLALGLPSSRLVGSSLSQLLAEARHDRGVGVPDPVTEALASGRPVSGRVLRLDRAAGGPAWLSVSVRPARGATVVVVADVTEEHRLRGALRETEALLPRVLDAVGIPTALLRSQVEEGSESVGLVVVHANRTAQALTGWVVGSRVAAVELDALGVEVQRVGVHEVVTWPTTGPEPPADGAGSAETAELLEAAVVASPVGALLLDGSGRLVIANPVADELLGGTPLLAGGPHTRRLLWADTKEPVEVEALPIRSACEEGKRFDDLELFVEDDSGSGVYLRVSGRPVLGPQGSPAGAVVSVVDDTATMEAQQALAAVDDELRRSNAELASFASTASHDLSQPLMKIYGFAQLLQMGGLDEAHTRDYVDKIVSGCERMRTLIRDLLAYSRLTSDARPFEPVDLAVVVREVLELFDREIADLGARVKVGLLPTVMADRTQMGQLVQNLVGNALTYVADGVPPVVQVSAARREGEWRVTVADNGIGISPEHRERAFRMFERLVTSEEYAGTGIGLAVCAKIAERHGGRIWIDGNPGGGTRVTFTIPDRPIG